MSTAKVKVKRPSSTVLIPDLVEGSARVIMTWSTPKPEAAGRDLNDLAADRNRHHPAAGPRAKLGPS